MWFQKTSPNKKGQTGPKSKRKAEEIKRSTFHTRTGQLWSNPPGGKKALTKSWGKKVRKPVPLLFVGGGKVRREFIRLRF